MADVGEVINSIRANGANVIIDGGKLRIVNSKKLPDGALDFLKQHGRDVANFIDREGEFEERTAIMEFEGGLTRQAAEYLTHLLHTSPPNDADPADWSWFVGQAAHIVDRDALRGGA